MNTYKRVQHTKALACFEYLDLFFFFLNQIEGKLPLPGSVCAKSLTITEIDDEKMIMNNSIIN